MWYKKKGFDLAQAVGVPTRQYEKKRRNWEILIDKFKIQPFYYL